MRVGERRHDDPVAVIDRQRVFVLFGNVLKNAGDFAVVQHDAPVFQNIQFSERGGVDDVAFDNLNSHDPILCKA